jgi:hypothetical protein
MTIVQWIAVTGIAAFAAIIGYFQWRTAHQRVILDLFDRRLKVYNEARKVVASIQASEKATIELAAALGGPIEEARFLFGNEVVAYLEGIYETILDAEACSFALERGTAPDRAKVSQQQREAMERILSFYKEGPPLFAPYMRLDQKMPGLRWISR